MTLDEVRQKYPQYKDVPDDKLAPALYDKFYKDKISFDDFSQKIGYAPSSQVTDLYLPKTPTASDKIVGAAETGLSAVTGAIAEPAAGLAGIAGSVLPGEEGQGADWVESAREALTYQPKTEAGQDISKAVGEVVQPVAEVVEGAEKALGDAVFDATGEAWLAAGATAIPAAVLEFLGVKTKGLKPDIPDAPSSKTLKAVTPTIQQIKSRASDIYTELDNMGVRVKPETYDGFATSIASKLEKEGIDPDLHPKSSAVLRRLQSEMGASKSLSELDTLRKVAQDAAGSIDPSDRRLGSIIINELDNGMDSLGDTIGGQYKNARQLWSRARKSEQIASMIERAGNAASGLENGLRVEARKILGSEKKRRGYSKDEIDALRKIAQGTTMGNIAKFLGKFGISENQATSMLGASIGAGGGAAIGSAFGPAGAGIGAITLPLVGQIAKKTASRITQGNTRFADELVRAGGNGREVIKAYIKNTPKAERNVGDLTALLLDPNVKPESLAKMPFGDKLVKDAIYMAQQTRNQAINATSAAIMSTPAIQGEQEQEQ